MHDELGANLTRIKLLSERIEKEAAKTEKVMAHARLISQASRELAESIDEIVWAVDPRRDRLEHLGSYLVAYAQEFLECAELRVRFDLPEVLPELPLSAHVRHAVFLAVKEALNNVVRHAHASEVRLGLAVRNGMLELRVSDNGCGLACERVPGRRSGLGNIQRRLAEIGGTCTIESAAGSGTRVGIAVKCAPAVAE